MVKIASEKEPSFDELSEQDQFKDAKENHLPFNFLRAHRFKLIKYLPKVAEEHFRHTRYKSM